MEETNKLYYGSIPRVLNEDILSFLCIKHKGEIGLGSKKDCPRIRIRYVIDKDRFGYADFGDFFFWDDGGLYVWQQSDEFEEDHNPDLVEDYFGHPRDKQDSSGAACQNGFCTSQWNSPCLGTF